MTTWATPRTWLSGEELTAALLNQYVRDQQRVQSEAFIAYTPVWSSSGTQPVLGNGVYDAAYKQVGKHVEFRMKLTFGNTTTFGTGTYFFTYPVPALVANNPGLGGWAFRTGPAFFALTAVGFDTTKFRMITSADNVLVTQNAPVTFNDPDEINIGGVYEAA